MKRYGQNFLVSALIVAFLLLPWARWNREAVSVWRPARMPESTLVIDAGHGGEDGGAVSISGAIESHINLAIALRLHALLNFCGADSVLIREEDRSIHDDTAKTLREKKVSDLHNRAAIVENTENAVLISVHQNTFTSQKYHGAQVFYGANPDSLPLAQAIQNQLRDVLDPENGRVPARIPSGVYLMNHITCPAVLVECGFLSHPEEDVLLQTPEYQTKLAAVLASSFVTYQLTGGEPLHEK